MPLARIHTHDLQEAAPVSEQLDALLNARGYTVETGVRSDSGPDPDLEISIERCPADEALVRATLRAEAIGGDVLLAAGALPSLIAEHSVVNEPMLEEPVPSQASATLPTTKAEAAVKPEPQAEPEALPIVAVSEPQPFDSSLSSSLGVASSLTPSMYGLTSSLPLDTASEAPAAPHEATPGPIAEAVSDLNAVLADSVAEADRMFTSGLRQLRRQLARGGSRAAASSQAEARRAQAERALPSTASARQVARPTPGAVSYARRLPRRRAALDYWRGAFTAASALAVLVMVGWALANSRPVAIPSDTSTFGQQVPFGPVAISPPRSVVQSPTATPAARRRSAPATAAPAARTSAARPKPQATRRRSATHSAAGNIAEDEVVVRHFGQAANGQAASATAAPNPTLSKTGPKRISDE